RRVADNPAERGKAEADVPTPETMPLAELTAHRARELTAYQNAAYAQRYLDRVDQVAKAEAIFGSEVLTRSVAVNLYKLMAYKDEYEVARLYSDGRFETEKTGTFKGGKAKVWLAPPIIAPKDSEGRPKKIAFGGWMLDYGFPVLAKLKGLRGTALDLFGHSEERRMERGLIADYQASLDRLLAGLAAEKMPLAVQIAQIPQQIRGYGHIKDASVTKAKAQEAALWGQWGGA
ncbi:MAG: indolepyruvate ferredoxin oxidoreductase family protein, partial [Phenylobacterium sp.]|nr:indolepyruvate ferredoxin oxidoreductase family protein [Phenylobacterium sp.]